MVELTWNSPIVFRTGLGGREIADDISDTCSKAATLTSDLLLQVKNDGHSLMEDEQFCLGLLAFQVQLAHATQLLEGLVDVPHSQAFTGVVGHPPLTLTLSLLFRIQILIFSDAALKRQKRSTCCQCKADCGNRGLNLTDSESISSKRENKTPAPTAH